MSFSINNKERCILKILLCKCRGFLLVKLIVDKREAEVQPLFIKLFLKESVKLGLIT